MEADRTYVSNATVSLFLDGAPITTTHPLRTDAMGEVEWFIAAPAAYGEHKILVSAAAQGREGSAETQLVVDPDPANNTPILCKCAGFIEPMVLVLGLVVALPVAAIAASLWIRARRRERRGPKH